MTITDLHTFDIVQMLAALRGWHMAMYRSIDTNTVNHTVDIWVIIIIGHRANWI